MGPRSADRGDQIVARRQGQRRRASMGPRSADRGDVKEFRLCLAPSLLQWGRDQLIAEIAASLTILLSMNCGPRGERPYAKLRFSNFYPPTPSIPLCEISSLAAASGCGGFRINPPLASPSNENRILIQLSFDYFGEQSSLHFQQTTVRNAVAKNRVRD